MRLLLISLGSIGVFLIMLLTARFWGLGLPYQEFKHPFFEQRALFTVQVENFGQATDAIKAAPDVVLWLDVRVTKDQKLIVISPATTDAYIKKENMGTAYLGHKIYYYNWSLLKTHFAEAKLLSDFIAQFPERRFVINVIDNQYLINELVRKELKDFNPDKRFLIHSETDVIVKTIKDLEPFWLYGISLPELTRIVTFSSIGLQPAISVRGDVLISALKFHQRTFINEDVLSEMKRRKKKILIGPLKNDLEINQAVGLFQKNLVDGFVVENPKQIKLISAQVGSIK
jgi:hypothetical protein